MSKFLASIIIGLSIFSGNISSQSQSYKIFDHIASEHSNKDISHEHHHGHSHRHSKKNEGKGKTPKDHNHNAELSALSIHLIEPVLRTISATAITSIKFSKVFASIDSLVQLSYPTSIFRPPIA